MDERLAYSPTPSVDAVDDLVRDAQPPSYFAEALSLGAEAQYLGVAWDVGCSLSSHG